MLNPATQSALSRISLLNNCLGVVSELMIPQCDLHVVDRDRLACLLGFLHQEYEAAERALHSQ